MEHAAFDLTLIGLLALICQWLAWRLKLPAILPLLIAGIVMGPVTGLLQPDALLGDLLFPLVSLAVAVILFEGSLTLDFGDLRGHGHIVRRLVTWGALVTGIIAIVAARYTLGLSWEMASVLGAVLVVTGPTVVLPLLQTLRAREHLSQILRWEGILIDPVGAIGAVLVYEFVALGASNGAATYTLVLFAKTALIGFGLGGLGGYLWGCVLRHHWLPQRLHSFGTLMAMLTLFTLSNMLFHESGLLTVTVMGVWLANMRGVPTQQIIEFKETLSVLLISGLFILLAARLTTDQLAQLSWPAWAFLLILVGVARPLAVWVCTAGTRLNWREKALLAWLSPRGIVAAAVASLFAIKLENLGMPGAEMLVPVTFLVIISTVVVQSLLSRPIALALKVSEPPPTGFLIIGANPVARAIAKALEESGFTVRLTDNSWDAVQEARMAGLPVYYGNPLSEHAAQHLELTGIGHLLPLSPYRELNNLAVLHFEHVLGHGKVFRLAAGTGKHAHRHQEQALDHLPLVFGESVTYAQLSSVVHRGGEVRKAKLSASFSFEDYRQAHQDRLLPLFCIGPNGRIRVANDRVPLAPRAGDTVISLIQVDSPEY
ncbi:MULTISPECIES: cation:proton antiporter [Chromohalobacter]|uniref:Sodium/proton antiporter, CPA1 family n=1 Tax=Chromohalobacter israelensis (strain ATCC BAA-138 / DSM 3043 / CIP 106854 / NCIMB 13768 / 1H11) TaxID=290398 RepID=Q1QV40_CHRI1|nr:MULTISPECIES: sodium:proton antiporter [Chromohalobacter]ABE59668.1 sodium/proton antiporter, CPA1 family [Chromohalobacter salexigens DSM 3043]MBZ5874597.1 cation:proton antiporter [Chromohalobacter salexigens]MDF9433402.1 cation:proton antiporter [Chromohalobacter israelensis]MDO0947049.1 sodium:proton antiporter [Chromohalobacter salexigens]NQY47070.1 sodium:proton antiporter [Chromohalobacter sp.]